METGSSRVSIVTGASGRFGAAMARCSKAGCLCVAPGNNTSFANRLRNV